MLIRYIPAFSLSQIADSGQCFRMNLLKNGVYSIIAFEKYLEIENFGDGQFKFSCTEDEFRDIWMDYFDLSCDYYTAKSLVPTSDNFLQAAIKYGDGLRILRQDPWEVTVSFIISQRKSIPAIKTAVESISTNFGKQLHCNVEGRDIEYYSFPSASHIALLTCSDISCCSLGYRDKYITSAAQTIAGGTINFSKLMNDDYETAKSSLLQIYGVGEKVANCILLFGLNHANAFPEDTWIKRIIDAEYGGKFQKELYEGQLGIIQQYMFFYGRSKEYQIAAPLNLSVKETRD